jgi:hypothetical protein
VSVDHLIVGAVLLMAAVSAAVLAMPWLTLLAVCIDDAQRIRDRR